MATVTTAPNSSTWLGSPGYNGGTPGYKYVATPFPTTTGGTVSSVTAKIFLGGGSGSPCIARFYTDSSTAPGTQVGTDSDSHTPGGTDCTNSQVFTFGTPVTLSASTNYWLVIYTTNAESASNYSAWCGAVASAPYGGWKHSTDGSTWSAAVTNQSEYATFDVTAPAGPANVKTKDGVTQSTGITTYMALAVGSTKSVEGVT